MASRTLLTLQRIDWVIGQLEQHYRFIADEGGLFYDNEGKSQQALLSSYARKRQQAQRFLPNASTPGCGDARDPASASPWYISRSAVATSALRLGWLAGSYSTQPQENASCQVSRLLAGTGHAVTERLHRCRGIVARWYWRTE